MVGIKKRSRKHDRDREEKVGSSLDYTNSSSTVGEVVGETIAKLELLNQKIIPYSRFIDHEGIDLITRFKKRGLYEYEDSNGKPIKEMRYDNPIFNEIQVKYSRPNENQIYTFQTRGFTSRSSYFFLFVCGDGKNIFIIPSRKLAEFMGHRRGGIVIRKDNENWKIVSNRRTNLIIKYKNNYSDLKLPNAMPQ